MRNLTDQKAFTQAIIDALNAGKTVEIAASTGVIRLMRDGDSFTYSQGGKSVDFRLSELETLRRTGYLTAETVHIVG